MSRVVEHSLGSSEAGRLFTLAEADSLITAAPMAIASIDDEYRFARFNDAFAALAGIDPAAHAGALVGEVIGSTELRNQFDQVMAYGVPVARTELVVATPHGSRIWNANLFRVLVGDTPRCGLIAVDVTEQRRSEQLIAESNERFALLSSASQLLSSSLHPSTVLERLARFLVPVMGDWCAIDLAEDGEIRRVAVASVDPVRRRELRRLQKHPPAPDSDHPVAEVIRTGTPLLIADNAIEKLLVGRQAQRRPLQALGAQSTMTVPLASRGGVLGALTVGSGERRYTTNDLELAEDIGRRAGVAVDNSRLYRDRGFIARTLQSSLLPPSLPDIDGIEIGAFYHAAGEMNEVGGDFYDIFATAPGDWAIVIGDVCGKGASAAATTALARYTIRAAAMQARRPSRVLWTLNEAMIRQQEEHRFCTALYARLRAGRDRVRLTVASGGHPLPLVVHADGSVEAIGKPGILVGIFDDFKVLDQTIDLVPGDTVVFYTDGLTEARGRLGLFEEEGLRRALSEASGASAVELAASIRRVVLEFQAGEARDDMALIALKIPF